MTEEQPTFAGIGSTAFIILKDDLQPDTLTPKDGKAWTKIDVNKSYSIEVEEAIGEGFEFPYIIDYDLQADRDRAELFMQKFTEETLQAPVDVFVTDEDGNTQHLGKVDPENITFRWDYEPQFRKRRLRVKFRKKLMHYIVRYQGRDPFDNIEHNIYLTSTAAPTSRFLSKMLNRKIKLAKRGKLEP